MTPRRPTVSFRLVSRRYITFVIRILDKKTLLDLWNTSGLGAECCHWIQGSRVQPYRGRRTFKGEKSRWPHTAEPQNVKEPNERDRGILQANFSDHISPASLIDDSA
jgi:hypothetical protein